MKVSIREAKSTDSLGIEQVRKAVWPGETSKHEHILSVVTDSNHITQVAIVEHAVVGFVDGFLTTSITGLRRWEIDLLAVHPDCQRRGIAKQLIRASSIIGCNSETDMARALICIGNSASMKAFSGCGYRAEIDVNGLFVLSANVPTHGTNSLPSNMNLIHANTINYQGLWIEGELSAEGLDAANRKRNLRSLDIIGAVIPLSQTRSIRFANSAGYNFVGRYRYWTLNYRAK
jgi:N-acetylglutamate synthase-like GNAT family acetyltransferase